jgi:hypothetical protein
MKFRLQSYNQFKQSTDMQRIRTYGHWQQLGAFPAALLFTSLNIFLLKCTDRFHAAHSECRVKKMEIRLAPISAFRRYLSRGLL